MTKDLLNMKSFDRRRVLQGIAGGLATAGTTTLFAPAVRAANKPIKIGYVSPKSGPLAAFAEADDFVLGDFRKFIKDGVKVGSQTCQVEVVTKDSQSNPNRAAEVAKELITRDNVGLIVVGATPETNNPVATQCELEQVPCISSVAPWQTNFIGRQANPGDQQAESRLGRSHRARIPRFSDSEIEPAVAAWD
jgi:branched-chain amino acid transport system substrate-binding protein